MHSEEKRQSESQMTSQRACELGYAHTHREAEKEEIGSERDSESEKEIGREGGREEGKESDMSCVCPHR